MEKASASNLHGAFHPVDTLVSVLALDSCRLGVSVALLAALFAAACGGHDERDPAVEMVEVFAAIDRARCHQWFKCCPAREIALHDLIGTTEAECMEEAEIGAALVFSDRHEGLSAGRIVFNIEQARGCLAAIKSATCATPDEVVDCSAFQIIEPRVPVGQACSGSHECIEGPCDRDEFGTELGTCMPKLPTGAPCSSSGSCASGVCLNDLGEARCIDRHDNGAFCNYDAECVSDECACEILVPEQVDCRGAVGVCETPIANGCELD